MKNINVIFEDKEFIEINKIRKKMTWRRFILKLCNLPYPITPFLNPQKYWYKRVKK